MANIEYLIVSGVLIAAGTAMFLMLLRALIASMAIKSLLYSLPVG